MSTQKFWTLTAVLVAVVAVVGGWFIGVSPRLDQITAANSELANVEAQNTAQQTRLTNLKKQYNTIGALNAQLADLQSEVTPVNDLSDFVDRVSALAESSGATLDKYAADAPVQAVTVQTEGTEAATTTTAAPAEGEDTTDAAATDTTDATATDTAATAAASTVLGDPNLYAIPITLTLTGTDEQVFDVVKQLQASKQLFLVKGVTFGGEDARTVTGFVFISHEQAIADVPTDGSTVN